MEYSPRERFFRRLHPRFHFVLLTPGVYRVSSAAFKGTPRIADGRYVNSVDAERLISLADERRLAAHQHPGYGIGALTYEAIKRLEAQVAASPTETNPAHHDILCTEKQSRKLADATVLIDWPPALVVIQPEDS